MKFCYTVIAILCIKKLIALFCSNPERVGGGDVVYCSNRGGEAGEGSMRILGPGNYGLSNSVLDCPWRKVQRGKELFGGIISEVEQSNDEEKLTQSLMELLTDDTW